MIAEIIQAVISFLSLLLLFFAVVVFNMRTEPKVRKGLQFIIAGLFIQACRSIFMTFGCQVCTQVEWASKFFESLVMLFGLKGAYILYQYHKGKKKGKK